MARIFGLSADLVTPTPNWGDADPINQRESRQRPKGLGSAPAPTTITDTTTIRNSSESVAVARQQNSKKPAANPSGTRAHLKAVDEDIVAGGVVDKKSAGVLGPKLLSTSQSSQGGGNLSAHPTSVASSADSAVLASISSISSSESGYGTAMDGAGSSSRQPSTSQAASSPGAHSWRGSHTPLTSRSNSRHSGHRISGTSSSNGDGDYGGDGGDGVGVRFSMDIEQGPVERVRSSMGNKSD